MRYIVLLAIAGCHAIPPPPMIALHADTAAAPKGSTTVVAVVGFAGTLFGGDGNGFAIRAEHQYAERTALGLELVAGRGSEAIRKGEPKVGHWLLGTRGYGRFTPRTHDWVAATYGAGLSYLDTGLVTWTAHAGLAVSAINDYVTPFAQLGFAGAWPLVRGERFGDDSGVMPAPRVREGSYAKRDLYFCFDGGFIGGIGESRFSADIMFAGALAADELVFGLSAAGAHRRDAR